MPCGRLEKGQLIPRALAGRVPSPSKEPGFDPDGVQSFGKTGWDGAAMGIERVMTPSCRTTAGVPPREGVRALIRSID
jgi:hypothetical protein